MARQPEVFVRELEPAEAQLVTDHSPSPPQLPSHDVHAAWGRGLQMVQKIARRWGRDQHTNGKTVWASIDRAHLAAQLA